MLNVFGLQRQMMIAFTRWPEEFARATVKRLLAGSA
jgi:hypothetical protein